MGILCGQAGFHHDQASIPLCSAGLTAGGDDVDPIVSVLAFENGEHVQPLAHVSATENGLLFQQSLTLTAAARGQGAGLAQEPKGPEWVGRQTLCASLGHQDFVEA